MKITFHGGAREVTGACYLLETGREKFLIDCGLFQGARAFEELNFKNFTFVPAEIDALFVTHGHLDHVGRIPKLVREGFAGKIYSTASTRDLARLILEDAFSLASREEKMLYEMADLERAFAQWHTLPYGESGRVGDVEFTLHNAGHILGSSFIEIRSQEKKILFTGDLGNIPSVLLRPPASVRGVDYLIIESTYGMRAHEPEGERTLKLERAVEDAASRRGTLLIPAFATERTQDILHLLNEMVHFKRIPEVPVFVDAPLAIRITEVFEKHHEEYREEIRELLRQHPHLFRFKRLRMTQSVEESKAINDVAPPKVIIAGSGMM
jgi:metallo-beta-lactamase family protein